MEKGETCLQAAFRETEEETGITGESFDLVPNFYVDEISKKGNVSVRYYVGIMKHQVNNFSYDPDELVHVGWYTFDQVFAMGTEIKPQRKEILHAVLNHLTGLSKKEETHLSKKMSWLLRHGAKERGLSLRPDGYLPLGEIFKLEDFKCYKLTQIQEMVRNNDKQRFSMVHRNGEWWIRANQGHSNLVGDLDSDALLTTITEPEEIVHGTYKKNRESIEQHGLKRMERQMIHFAPVADKEKLVRINCNMFVFVDMAKAMADGIKFYRSANGVILTEGVDGTLPPQYLSRFE